MVKYIRNSLVLLILNMDLDDSISDNYLMGDSSNEIVPGNIKLNAIGIKSEFHPIYPIIGIGTIEGSIIIHQYNHGISSYHTTHSEAKGNYTKEVSNLKNLHTAGITDLEFFPGGQYLASVSSDKSISVINCETQTRDTWISPASFKANRKRRARGINASSLSKPITPVDTSATESLFYLSNKDTCMQSNTGESGLIKSSWSIDDIRLDTLSGASAIKPCTRKATRESQFPHKYGISALNVCSEHIICTGDDDGRVCLWDLRVARSSRGSEQCVATYYEHADYISKLLYFDEHHHLITSSGDSTIGVFDCRGQGIVDISEPRKDELLSMCFIAGSNTLVCGTTSGELPLFKYHAWRRPYDMLSKHPQEVETIVPFNDNIILTGSSDGVVRAVQLHPIKRVLAHFSSNSDETGGVHDQMGGRKYTLQSKVCIPTIVKTRISQAPMICSSKAKQSKVYSFPSMNKLTDDFTDNSNDINSLSINPSQTLVSYCTNSATVKFIDISVLSNKEGMSSLHSKKTLKYISLLDKLNEDDEGSVNGEFSNSSSTMSDADESPKFHAITTKPKSEIISSIKGVLQAKKEMINAKRNRTTSSSSATSDTTSCSSSTYTTTETSLHTVTNPPENPCGNAGGQVSETYVDLFDQINQRTEDNSNVGDCSVNLTGWSERAKKRSAVVVSNWLKGENREKLNFKGEKKRKRVKGFWRGLMD